MQFTLSTVYGCTSTVYSLKGSEYFKTFPQFSYSFNRNAFICMVRRSCSQTTSVICSGAHKQWLNFPLFQLTKTNSKTPRYLSYLIKEDYHYCSILHHELTYYHENKARCIPLGIENTQKNIINLTACM